MTLETRIVLTREFSVIWDVLSQKKACIFWMQCVHIISHFRKSGETERRSCLSRGSCVNRSPSKAPHTLPSSSHVFQLFWNILWLCGLGMIVMRAGSRSSELCLAPLAHPSLCMLLIFPPQKKFPATVMLLSRFPSQDCIRVEICEGEKAFGRLWSPIRWIVQHCHVKHSFLISQKEKKKGSEIKKNMCWFSSHPLKRSPDDSVIMCREFKK